MTVAVADSGLDRIDRLLVSALQVDGRAGAARIAEVLGLSERTVTRRLARLVGAGLVRVVAVPPIRRLRAVPLLLRVKVLRGRVHQLADALAARPDVLFVDVLSDGEEITVATYAGSARRDRLLFEELPATSAITSSTAYAVLHVFADAASWRTGLLTPAQVAALAVPDAEPERELDELDRALLTRLGVDGRASAAALAGEVGAPAATVRRRLAALRASGQLRLHATVDPALLGARVEADLWLSVPPGELDRVGRGLAAHPAAHGVAATTGPTNLLVTVFFPDLAELYGFLTGTVGALPVTQVETTLVGRSVKRAGVRLPPGAPIVR